MSVLVRCSLKQGEWIFLQRHSKLQLFIQSIAVVLKQLKLLVEIWNKNASIEYCTAKNCFIIILSVGSVYHIYLNKIANFIKVYSIIAILRKFCGLQNTSIDLKTQWFIIHI